MLTFIKEPAPSKAPATRVLFVCEDTPLYKDSIKAGLCEKIGQLPEFEAKPDKSYFLMECQELPVKRLIFIGLGKSENFSPEIFRKAAAAAVKAALSAKEEEIGVYLPEILPEKEAFEEAIMEGLILANDRLDTYKKKDEDKKLLKKIGLIAEKATAKQKSLLEKTLALCSATLLARSWVSMPPNEKRPKALAELLSKAAKKEGLQVSIMGKKELEKEKFNCLLAVSQGSTADPAFLVLKYQTSNPKAKTVALVGKAITFDSGGLSLKPPASMKTMKSDMAGAAAVTGLAIACARTKVDFNLVCAIPIAENMPSGSACRPGDIVVSKSGKSVEILNTDAEGRLILADALSWVVENEKPDLMIDVATLTGACMIALGEEIAGCFTQDSALAHAFHAAGQSTWERTWPMPLPEDYEKYLKSDFADISNLSSSTYGGAITAALFLKEFVGETRWAHLDIAGPAYTSKAQAYCPAGGTGFGVRLLYKLLTTLSENLTPTG